MITENKPRFLLDNWFTKFVCKGLHHIATNQGDKRSVFKAARYIFDSMGCPPTLSASLAMTDLMCKFTDVGASFETLRVNDFKGITPAVKAVSDVFYFFSCGAQIASKHGLLNLGRVAGPLACVVFVADVGMAALAAGESLAKVADPRTYQYGAVAFRDKQRAWEQGIRPEKESKAPQDPVDRQKWQKSHIEKWEKRKIVFGLELTKNVLNIAFQVSLIALFVLVAAPSLGYVLGAGAALTLTAGLAVTTFSLMKLGCKVAALATEAQPHKRTEAERKKLGKEPRPKL